MRSYLLLTAFLSLVGCGMDDYKPPVVGNVNQTQYNDDTKDCIAYSKEVRGKFDPRSLVISQTGLAGYAVLDATKSNENDTYFKSGYELTDECMRERGYQI